MANNFNLSSDWIFGGSTTDATVTVPVTLADNAFNRVLTLNSGAFITTSGYKIFCSEKLILTDAVITCSGENALLDQEGYSPMATVSTPFGEGMHGAAGRVGGANNGVAATPVTAYNSLGGAGGKGGDSPGNTGGNGAAVNIENPSWQEIMNLIGGGLYSASDGAWVPFRAGGGGGSGSKDGTSTSSGGGGAGGGVIVLAAPIIHLTNGFCAVNARGGNGGNAVGPDHAGGGGGGGGGVIILIYHKLINNGGVFDTTGGTGGNHVGGMGTGGLGGGGGRLIQVDLSQGKITVTAGSAGANGS